MDATTPNRIKALPEHMRDEQLVDWPTTKAILSAKSERLARRVLRAADVPLVQVSERRAYPRWGALRDFLRQREQAVA